jgi:chemotaxis protein CheD
MEMTPGKIHVVQGQYRISDDPNAVLSTILGSCVAACMRDPVAGVGGINHFLLPGEQERERVMQAERYGVHLMELLVNDLLKRGARRDRLEAKLFGGAQMIEGLVDIGNMNAGFAERFLKHENITYVGGSLGGRRGRRIEYWPVSGRARQIFMASQPKQVEAPKPPPPPVRAPQTGVVEFF